MKDRWGYDEEEVDLPWEYNVWWMVDQRNGRVSRTDLPVLDIHVIAYLRSLHTLIYEEGHNKIRRQSEMEALQGSPKVSFSLSSDVGKACR